MLQHLVRFKQWLINLWLMIKLFAHMLVDDDWQWEMESDPPSPGKWRPSHRKGVKERIDPRAVTPLNREERRAIRFHPHTLHQQASTAPRAASYTGGWRPHSMASPCSGSLDPTRRGARSRGRP